MKKSILLIVVILIFVIGGMACTETPQKWIERGGKALFAKNHDEALKCYKRALAIDPNSARAHLYLGWVYQIKGMVDEAISENKKAIGIAPNNKGFRNSLGSIYLKEGMLDEAISEFKKAIAIDPDYAAVHYKLGIAYGKKNQNTLAAHHLYEAGFLYISEGDNKAALKAYRGLEEIKAGERAQDLYKIVAPWLNESREK